jgi:hypothetical protein
MEIKYDSVIKRMGHAWKRFEGGAVLVRKNKTMEKYYLNKAIGEVWLYIDGRSSVSEIFEAMERGGMQLSDADKEQILIFLNELYEEKLVDYPANVWT